MLLVHNNRSHAPNPILRLEAWAPSMGTNRVYIRYIGIPGLRGPRAQPKSYVMYGLQTETLNRNLVTLHSKSKSVFELVWFIVQNS